MVPPKSKSIARAFELEDVAPDIYLDVLTDRYGKKWLLWEEPETVWQTIEVDFGLMPGLMSQVAKDKISVMRSLANQDAVFHSMDAYENAVLAFNDVLATWDVIEMAEPEQLSYFHHVVRISKSRVSQDVHGYVGAILAERGWVVVPPELAMFQQDLDAMNIVSMGKQHLDFMKDKIRSGFKSGLVDDDTNPVSVAVARHAKVRMYIKDRVSREASQRTRFGVRHHA